LQFAVEWGVPALGLMILGFMVALRGCAGRLRGVWAWGVLAVLLHGLVDFPLQAPVSKVLFAIALGAMTCGQGTRIRRSSMAVGGRWLVVMIGVWIVIAFLRPALARWSVEHPRGNLVERLRQALHARAVFPLDERAASFEGKARWDLFWDLLPRTPKGGELSASRLTESALRLASELSGYQAPVQLELGKFLVERAQVVKGRRERLRDLAEARRVFLGAAEASPRWPWPWVWLAQTWMEERAWTKAEVALAEALRREPLFLYATIVRGEIEERRGASAAARRWYRRALLLKAHLQQRPGPNVYERALYEFDDGVVKGRLMNLERAQR